ncbi:hypothetical protein [Caenimonas soli]|uniref:hypothetical protein n=1 Tax=Caenimonas soli TaxID=2735555 RepID=UPI0015543B4B|nr:hypothetical protein [Caenimonas soli]NPC54667.1 hypothetical protein [Caenimonas soli]
MTEKRIRNLVIATAAAAVLAACGGGGGNPGATSGSGGTTTTTTTTVSAASAVDKYVGTWLLCLSTGVGSTSQTLVFAKTGDAALSYTFTFRTHTASGCTGTATVIGEGTGTVAVTGTKLVGTEIVDKWITTENGQTQKMLAVIRNSRLFFSIERDQPGFTEDSEGYPNTLDEGSSLAKQ